MQGGARLAMRTRSAGRHKSTIDMLVKPVAENVELYQVQQAPMMAYLCARTTYRHAAGVAGRKINSPPSIGYLISVKPQHSSAA